MNCNQLIKFGYKLSCVVLLPVFVCFLIVSCQDIEKNERVYQPENFTSYEGIEIHYRSQFSTSRDLRLLSGLNSGQVSRYYFGQPARFTVALTGIHTGPGSLTVQLLVNSEDAGSFEFPSTPDVREPSGDRLVKEILGIDIPRYSKIDLKFNGIDGQGWGIERIILIPEGKYQGDRISLPEPQTPRVYSDIEEQNAGHSMLRQFVQQNVEKQEVKRDAVISALKSAEEFRAYQNQVRENLSSIFGPFPEKTPLNPRVVGRIDFTDYVIEKIIYESQPDLFVPANLYIPKKREFPLPGVLFTLGHWEFGKLATDFNAACKGLAKKGYVVLAADPIGQGERREYFDPGTLECTVCGAVNQHHYVGRPAFLANWSLSTIRTWDCIRGVDYLVSRPEVDTSKLAVAGNSGGGQLAMLIAAVDKRIKVVAAAHPGGSMEATYLTGRGGSGMTNLDLVTLIPPRPCRIIVGDASGEATGHGIKLEEMEKFYRGFGISEDHWDMDIVEGVHDNSLSKRESFYEWLNLWFDKTGEGKEEPFIEETDMEKHWCTENGLVLASIGGESGQTLNQKHGEQVYQKTEDTDELKKRVSKRLHLELLDEQVVPEIESKETFALDDIAVEKFIYVSEPGIAIPALLLRPVNQSEKEQVILHVSVQGKPQGFNKPSLPIGLVRSGHPVLSIDVRGTGETANHPPSRGPDKYISYTSEQFARDAMAVQSVSFGRTMLGMRSLDVVKGIDFLAGRSDLEDRPVIIIGEGLGGLWALLGGIYRPEVQAVITVNTLPSYKLLLSSKYYNLQDYFWVPGALKDYDIPDLGRLVGPRSQLWIDPVNPLSERMTFARASEVLGNVAGLQIVFTANGLTDEISKEILNFLNNQP